MRGGQLGKGGGDVAPGWGIGYKCDHDAGR